MTAYKNISEQWGDAVEVTVDDYRQQAEIFGVAADDIEERDDGIYIAGERVAEAIEPSLESLISTNVIHIVSGEGEIGTRKIYRGKRTLRAIKMRITRERCGGDRWAGAEVYSHENEWGKVGYDVLTGQPCTWHDVSE